MQAIVSTGITYGRYSLCCTMLLIFPQKLSYRTTSVPIRHSIPTSLISPLSVTWILNPSWTASVSILSRPFLRADLDQTFPVTAPIHRSCSHMYSVIRKEVKNRCIRGIVIELDNGALMWNCGVFGRCSRSAYAEGHDTSYRQIPETEDYLSRPIRKKWPCYSPPSRLALNELCQSIVFNLHKRVVRILPYCPLTFARESKRWRVFLAWMNTTVSYLVE